MSDQGNEDVHGKRAVRQWRVTITESPNSTTLNVLLAWRTFPCRADQWDGWADVRVPDVPLPITSQEALRAVLEQLVAAHWEIGRPGRRR